MLVFYFILLVTLYLYLKLVACNLQQNLSQLQQNLQRCKKMGEITSCGTQAEP